LASDTKFVGNSHKRSRENDNRGTNVNQKERKRIDKGKLDIRGKCLQKEGKERGEYPYKGLLWQGIQKCLSHKVSAFGRDFQ
jgi:hypothetical protein